MSKDIRRIGDNSANINPIEQEAIKSIKSIYENLIVQQKYSEKSVNGKNKTIRDNNTLMSVFQCWKMLTLGQIALAYRSVSVARVLLQN